MLKKPKIYIISLFLVVIIASVLRLYALASNPPEMTWDEVAWGYNAYALGIDGRDEFGKFMPIQYLESFGDFKPPVYAYLDILPVKLFGLNAFAVRLPSALAGIGTVLMTYFLLLRLFPKSKNKEWYGLATAVLLAISPWHVLLSRAAFEANVASFFIVIGVWSFLAGIQEKKCLLVLSAVSFVIPFYTFNSPRVFLPLFFIVLLVGFWKQLWERKKQTIIAGILFLVLLSPLIPFLLSPQGKLRYNEVNIFTDSSVVVTSNQEIVNDHNSIVAKIINNRRVLYSIDFFQHYFDEFNPQFLFFWGDPNPKFSIQTAGELFIWCLPFFYAGFFLLFRKREGYWWLIPVWLLLSIIPAATARETPHALRTEVALPTFQLIIAYSFVLFIQFILEKERKRKILWKGIGVFLLFVMCFECIKFIHSYTTHYPIQFSTDWQYGYKDSIAFVKEQQNQYDRIEVSDTLGRPYIYYLFYLQIDPRTYRSEADVTRDVFGFVTVNRFGKYYFPHDFSKVQTNGERTLFITDPKDVPGDAKVVQRFFALDNTPVLVAYTQ